MKFSFKAMTVKKGLQSFIMLREFLKIHYCLYKKHPGVKRYFLSLLLTVWKSAIIMSLNLVPMPFFNTLFYPFLILKQVFFLPERFVN